MKTVITTVVVAAVIAIMIVLAVVNIVRRRRRGEHICSCGGNCEACGLCPSASRSTEEK